MGLYPIIPLMLSWVANNNVGHTKRAVSVALLNTFGQCFATVGTQIYKTPTAPRFFMGYGVCLAFTVVMIVVSLVLTFVLDRENKRRDEQYGEPKPLTSEEQQAAIDNGIYDDHGSFRISNMSPFASDPHDFYQVQQPSPGTAVKPTQLDISQGFANGPNPDPLPKLFHPLKIRGITAKNRIWVSPMCMYSAQDGFPTDFHLSHYSQYAIRGAGLVMVEATGVLPEGRISPNCLGIWKDEHIASYRRIVSHMHKYGTIAAIQIGHGGRKGSTIPLQ
ncbi:hypothetical protein GGF43_006692, partial [Coemansia sp. RSA 2618]